jgi:uncharacterized protein YcfL
MRNLNLFLIIMIVVLLSACQSSDQIKPIKEETIDFDMNTAIEMVEKKEQLIIPVRSFIRVTSRISFLIKPN